MKYPKSLRISDTIGLIAPAGPLRDIEVKEIKYELNRRGFKVKIGNSCYLNYKGYLSGKDIDRARDLENMFLDKDVDAIFCVRGGYGTTRILDLIDLNIIRDNPKIFVGFSDITALHIVMNQCCNLPTYHGIMASSIKKWDEFSYESLLKALNFEKELLIENPHNEKTISLYGGCCEGEIIGGNLSLLVSTLGTKYEINTNNKIIFIEEIGEYTYKIDKMLNHLYMAGKFADCKGIIFGEFTSCNKSFKHDDEIINILKEIVYKSKKPTLCNLKSGHCMPMVTLPMGFNCYMDSNNNIIKIIK
ncbi:S66 peptidase family protein [Terrisporobacter sp.]|uniref:S66 peptidase family protein n=1 Tax=Terrisporobacter sp. TaxID=1965305 RepID=UPI002616D40B|nr:LD-carboxypeptidase [Terrisporobacter sp.]